MYTDSEACDPNAFADFLNWIKDLEESKTNKLKIGAWGSVHGGTTQVLLPPEKIILLGDILELWTASNESIFASTMDIMQLLSKLNCEKIYVLGNHDHDLIKIKGRYPLGASDIEIIEEDEYWISKGGERYCFLHGQQFDKLFIWKPEKLMAPIRMAALAFGDYTWILVALCLANFIIQTIVGVWGVADIMLTLLLTAVSLPYSFLFFSRRIWNYFSTIKFNPKSVHEKYEKKRTLLWEKFSKKLNEKSDVLTIVHGHTHTIDNWIEEGRVESNGGYWRTFMEVFNIPSWVKNTSEEKESIKNEISHAFLYITEHGSDVFGWDWKNKKPFLIPKDIIFHKREHGNLSKFKHQYDRVLINNDNIEQKLDEIDWPKELIKKWMTGFQTDLAKEDREN